MNLDLLGQNSNSVGNFFRIWDFSVEGDEEEDRTKEKVQVPEGLSPNLLFIHQVFNVCHFFGFAMIFLRVQAFYCT